MLGSIGAPELIVIVLIALLLFGAGRIADIGKGLGQGIKNFKQGLKESNDDADDEEKPKKAASKSDKSESSKSEKSDKSEKSADKKKVRVSDEESGDDEDEEEAEAPAPKAAEKKAKEA